MPDFVNSPFARIQKVLRKRPVRRAALLFIAAMLLFFVACYMLAPVNLIREYRMLSESDSTLKQSYDPQYEIPEIIPFLKKKLFNQALLELAFKDSIHLVVDLRDSTVFLTIHGVIISSVKAAGVEWDPVLEILAMKEYISLFSKPLEITRQQATIIKEPVVVRHAPRDTLEAILNAYLPDTLVQRPAFMELQLQHRIKVVFEQETSPHFRDRWVKSLFRLHSSGRNQYSCLMAFISATKMNYSPKITIRMEAEDIRAIFRAIPSTPYIVIAY